MKSNKTREKILDASLTLFNEKKASNVSTVQISAAMKISPGNLYYYFANKEELIRCIWTERMLGEIGSLFDQPGEIDSVEKLLGFFEGCFRHYSKYRFFYTEISTLFVNDKKMMDLYQETSNKEIDAYIKILERWVKDGNMRTLSAAEKLALADNCMILLYNAVSYCDFVDDAEDNYKCFVRAAWFHIMLPLSPFLTEEKRQEINAELTKRGFSEEKYLELRGKSL